MISFKIRHSEMIPPEEIEKYTTCFKELSEVIHDSNDLLIYLARTSEDALNSDKANHSVAILMIMEFIDVIDSIEILVASGAASACIPQLRVALELYLGLVFLTSDRSLYEKRSKAYQYWDLLQRSDWIEKGDPNSSTYKSIAGELKNDYFVNSFDFAGLNVDFDSERTKFQVKLASSEFAETHAEYERFKNTTSRKPNNWFSLWDGPKTLRELAKHLNHLSMYETIYRFWSATAHGESAMKRHKGHEGGIAMLRAIRSPTNLPSQVQHACNLILHLCKLIVENFIPDRRPFFSTHYMDTIKPLMKRIEKYKSLNDNKE